MSIVSFQKVQDSSRNFDYGMNVKRLECVIKKNAYDY